MVGWPGGIGRAGADEGAFLHARDVIRIGAMVVAAGKFLLVELDQDARIDRLLREAFLFCLTAVAPVDLVRLTELRGFIYPGENIGVMGLRQRRIGYGKRYGGGGHDRIQLRRDRKTWEWRTSGPR